MTEVEARALCVERAREHPERQTHRWFAREGPEGWGVVKVALPEGLEIRPLSESTEARPRPPQAEDPRTAAQRVMPRGWA
jgi:hypothetical protein